MKVVKKIDTKLQPIFSVSFLGKISIWTAEKYLMQEKSNHETVQDLIAKFDNRSIDLPDSPHL